MTRFQLALLAGCLFANANSAMANEGYFRFPAIHDNTIAFTSEGDLWTVSSNGGDAHRLTSNAAEEVRPVISPDGKWIAFTASYEGAQEVYVMPITGGDPQRVTFNNSRAFPVGWTAKGEVLYTTFSASGIASERIVAAVNPVTMQRTIFPLADANDAVLDDKGETLYFVRFGLAMTNDNARHYRGGAISQLWRYNLKGNSEAERIGPVTENLRRPMWWNGRLIVISDHDGHDNLWSMQPDGSDMQQLTQHHDFDVRSANQDQGRVVYQLGADIRVYELASHTDTAVPIHLLSDDQQARDRWIRQPLQFASTTDFAPAGDRVAITVRGHVLVAGQNKLRRVEIAHPAGSRLRSAVLSPDGKWVYAICDASGENEIWRFPADGSEGGKALTSNSDGFRVSIHPSPDGKWLAHADKKGRLWLLELATGKNALIDNGGVHGEAEYARIQWSPDSHNLAFVRPNTRRDLNQIALFSLDKQQTFWLTDDKYDSNAPTFTPDGHWLYFLSDRQFSASNHSPWGDRNTGPYFTRRTKVYALALQAGEHFPFAPKNELGNKAEPAEKPDSTAKKDEAKTSKQAPIALDGLADRLYEVPVAAADYHDLGADNSRLYLLDGDGDVLRTLATDNKGAPAEIYLADIETFDLSADGKKLFLRRKATRGAGDMFIVDAGSKAPTDLAKEAIALGDWSLHINPRDEWKQMFADAWRMHRDFFYDPAMRGVNWLETRKKYEPLVERIRERAELDDVLGQMSAELGALHSQIAPGEERQATDTPVAAGLGADLQRVNNGWQITRIFHGDRDIPSERGPLDTPDVDAQEGDVITAVNGQASKNVRDFSDLLRNQAGQQTLLEIQHGNNTPHKVVVTPIGIAQQNALRYSDWEQRNLKKVEQASGGKFGYLHLRAMGAADISAFAREFYAQYDREGLIIDVRRNNGGNIDSWVIEKLMRRVWAFWKRPIGNAESNMQQTFRGHLVVLTDPLTYSDGETFSAGIKALKLAPLVGARTAGAGVWLNDANRLVDMGMARVAESPQFGLDGRWLVEGEGVSPDVEVENLPHATFMGEDKQLNTAIAILMRESKENPVPPLQSTPIPPLGSQ